MPQPFDKGCSSSPGSCSSAFYPGAHPVEAILPKSWEKPRDQKLALQTTSRRNLFLISPAVLQAKVLAGSTWGGLGGNVRADHINFSASSPPSLLLPSPCRPPEIKTLKNGVSGPLRCSSASIIITPKVSAARTYVRAPSILISTQTGFLVSPCLCVPPLLTLELLGLFQSDLSRQ